MLKCFQEQPRTNENEEIDLSPSKLKRNLKSKNKTHIFPELEENSFQMESLDSKLSRSPTKKLKNPFMRNKKHNTAKSKMSKVSQAEKKKPLCKKLKKREKEGEFMKQMSPWKREAKKSRKLLRLPSCDSDDSYQSNSECFTIKEILSKIENGELQTVFKSDESPLKKNQKDKNGSQKITGKILNFSRALEKYS